MNRAATIALVPLSAVYGLVVRIRNGLYRRGLRKILDVEAPVISVGNLTTGGTGKTPLVELLASRMAGNGWRVCVAAARWAVQTLGSQLIILDDAFQHQKIRRTVNIVVIDATNAFGNGWLLPAGRLREPLKELKRADCVVITRVNESEDPERLRAHIKEIAGSIPIFNSNIKLTEVRSLNRSRSARDVIDPKVAVASFCGIGNPNSFAKLLRREGYDVVHSREFRDHYSYAQSDINQLVREASAHDARALITTTKDAVKLRALAFDLPCYVVDASIQIEEPEAFFRFIDQLIQR